MKSKLLCLLASACLLAPLSAAINPAGYQRIASDVVRVREIARIVHTVKDDGRELRRTTIVAQVIAEKESRELKVGDTLVIDYTVDLVALAKAAKNHEAKYGNRPGPQFMTEPEPPELDKQKEFWVHLAKAGGRLGNVNRHAGAVVGIGDYAFKGDVFVPVAGQYSFDPPF